MAKGYWVVRIDVKDPEVYADYVKANAEPLVRHGAKFLVRGGKHEVMEGSTRARNVVLEFPSYEAALACFHDPAYQKANAIRQKAAVSDLIIVEGYEGVQPGD
jgi:uncharacterized protein (DUF1330 family)